MRHGDMIVLNTTDIFQAGPVVSTGKLQGRVMAKAWLALRRAAELFPWATHFGKCDIDTFPFVRTIVDDLLDPDRVGRQRKTLKPADWSEANGGLPDLTPWERPGHSQDRRRRLPRERLPAGAVLRAVRRPVPVPADAPPVQARGPLSHARLHERARRGLDDRLLRAARDSAHCRGGRVARAAAVPGGVLGRLAVPTEEVADVQGRQRRAGAAAPPRDRLGGPLARRR
ncbi:unnamed protein product, partial [Prorocentrum cordatum]